MDRNKWSASAIVVGALAFIVTMVLHPAGGSMERILRIAPLIIGTHSLAIASLAISVLGFLGLTRHLRADPLFAPAGLVAYLLGAVAAMCAAVLNGLALPTFIRLQAEREAGTSEALRLTLDYNHALNASFARVYLVATAAAVVLWSIAILRTQALARWSGVVGVLAGSLGLLLVLGGVVDVDVHDFGLFVFGCSAWALLIGLLLWFRAGSP